MKTISIFQVQDINKLLKDHQYDYILKLRDACGSQSLYLECTGKKSNIDELCTLINEFLKKEYLQVVPGTIDPYNLLLK